MPDEQVLLTAFEAASRLARDAATLTPATDLSRGLIAMHRAQSLVLRDLLRGAGVPDEVVAAAVPAAPAPPTPAQLAAAEATALTATALDTLSGATTLHRPTLTAVAASRAAAATGLGSTVAWPASDALPGAGLVRLLDATRAVAYGFEIVAAHLADDARAAALATLQQVRQREGGLLSAAGSAAPPEPLGYGLPFPVRTAGEARRLATTILTGLIARGLDPLTTLPTGSRAIGTLVRLQAEAVTLAAAWGVAPTPFPGMTYP